MYRRGPIPFLSKEGVVFRTVAALTFGCLALLTVGASGQQAAAPTRPGLDYEYFKSKVQPIFLKKRPGHARCVACHGQGTPLRLQPLDPGATTWTDEESRKNFDVVRRVVVPGSLKSKLLIHPLAEDAGGDFYHNGKHFASQNDPEWQTLRNWVMGQTSGTN
jgi:hypothetical protein